MRTAEITKSKSEPLRRHQLAVWMGVVSRYFDDPHSVRALTQVSFEVRQGEVFGLLGPSGSGKSTTLRILAGRLSPSDGKARVFGCKPGRHSAKMRVGYLPQRPSHNQSHLLVQAMDFVRALRIWRKRRPLREPSDTIPGNKRFAILKQLLIRNPDLLLLDEPFCGLGAAGCSEIKDLVLALARRGKTIILTSDSLAHARDVCDRVAVYYGGKIEAIGTLDEILASEEAIRAISPVLAPETAQRLLRVLREDLGGPGSEAAPSSVMPQCETEATKADDVLAPLAGIPSKPAPREIQEQIASPAKNERLSALTKSASTDSPHEPT